MAEKNSNRNPLIDVSNAETAGHIASVLAYVGVAEACMAGTVELQDRQVTGRGLILQLVEEAAQSMAVPDGPPKIRTRKARTAPPLAGGSDAPAAQPS